MDTQNTLRVTLPTPAVLAKIAAARIREAERRVAASRRRDAARRGYRGPLTRADLGSWQLTQGSSQ
jgi:hypothetical protein